MTMTEKKVFVSHEGLCGFCNKTRLIIGMVGVKEEIDWTEDKPVCEACVLEMIAQSKPTN